MDINEVKVNDRVKLAESAKLEAKDQWDPNASGATGLVVRKTKKFVWVLLDADVERNGDKLIRKADEAAYMRGETVKNVKGEDFRDTLNDDKTAEGRESAVALGVSFYQVAEDFAIGVSPSLIEEVLVDA